MVNPYTTLISPAQLQELGTAAFVVDCSHDLAAPDAGQQAWQLAHIPGAIHLHLDRDLAGPVDGQNGRHPLPDPVRLAARLAAAGLRQHQQVVAYDRSQGMYAARLWWLLRSLGHAAVAVLDGGWQAWQQSGGGAESTAAQPRPAGDFQIQPGLVGSVDAATVLADLDQRQLLVIDARTPQRYAGEGETLDPVGGHIPGAVCRCFRDNLQADGRFKPAAVLRAEWQQLLGERPPASVVSQCGSGVTACVNLLALEQAGLTGARLYPGSWSEWCADPSRPVAVGVNPG